MKREMGYQLMRDSYIENDKPIRLVPTSLLAIIMKKEIVITKEEFLMCYKAWVENEVKENG